MDKSCSLVPYSNIYRNVFITLNKEWITKYFEMEPMDFKVLYHPKEHILDKGGYIAIALLDDSPWAFAHWFHAHTMVLTLNFQRWVSPQKHKARESGNCWRNTSLLKPKLWGAKRYSWKAVENWFLQYRFIKKGGGNR